MYLLVFPIYLRNIYKIRWYESTQLTPLSLFFFFLFPFLFLSVLVPILSNGSNLSCTANGSFQWIKIMSKGWSRKKKLTFYQLGMDLLCFKILYLISYTLHILKEFSAKMWRAMEFNIPKAELTENEVTNN